MISRRQSSRLLIGGALAAAGAGIRRAGSAETKTKPVKIGLTWPMSGVEADWAMGMKAAVTLAIEDANARAPIPDYTISLRAEDEGDAVPGPTNAGRSATNGRALTDDNDVMGIIGPRFTEAVKMMQPLMARAHMAFISPAVSDPDVTDPTFDRTLRPTSVSVFFRNISTDVVQASALARYFSQRLDITSVFGLDDGTPKGADIVDRFQGAAERARIRWLGRGRLDPQAADLAPVLDTIRQLDPRAVYFGGGPEALGSVAPALHRMLPHAVVGTSNVACDALRMSKADVAATAGWYTTAPWAHLVADEATADLRRRLTEAMSGGVVDDRMILMYDATQVMIDAIRRAAAPGQDLLPFMVRNALRATKLDTLQGPIEFSAAGDVLAQAASVFQVVDGADGPLKYIEGFTQSSTEPALSSRRRDL